MKVIKKSCNVRPQQNQIIDKNRDGKCLIRRDGCPGRGVFSSSLQHRIQDGSDLLIDRKQYPAAEDRSSQSHRRSSPEASYPVIRQNAPEGLHSTGPLCTLRSRLKRVERLSSVRGDRSCHRSVREVRSRALRDLSAVLIVLEDVVRPHAEGGGPSLLESGASESTIEPQESVFGVNDPHSVGRRVKTLYSPGIVYQGRLDTLRGRDGEDAGDDTSAHTSKQVTYRRQGSCVGVFESILDQVEREEADAIFSNRANDQRGAAFIQRPRALIAKHVSNDKEGIAWSGSFALVSELDPGLSKLKWICCCSLDTSSYSTGNERHDWNSLGSICSRFWTH